MIPRPPARVPRWSAVANLPSGGRCRPDATFKGDQRWSWYKNARASRPPACSGLLRLDARHADGGQRLFRNQVFVSAGVVALLVALAMLGAIAFLPLYFQVAKGIRRQCRDCSCFRSWPHCSRAHRRGTGPSGTPARRVVSRAVPRAGATPGPVRHRGHPDRTPLVGNLARRPASVNPRSSYRQSLTRGARARVLAGARS